LSKKQKFKAAEDSADDDDSDHELDDFGQTRNEYAAGGGRQEEDAVGDDKSMLTQSFKVFLKNLFKPLELLERNLHFGSSKFTI
jgi:hypothetical protein